MATEIDLHRRGTFDSIATTYGAIRPGYPEALFDTLVEAAGLRQGAHLLEIGPGTGHATVPLAQRGYEITAVELGENLAAELRSALLGYPQVHIVVGAFEDTQLPEGAFELVYAARGFHWIRPDVRFTKSHALLKPGGHLAIIRAHDISDEAGDLFFHASQPIYARYDRETSPDNRLPRLGELQPHEMDTALFSRVRFAVFPTPIACTAAQYAQLLGTYSPTLAMAAPARQAFLAEIETLINSEFGGAITRHLTMSLTVARKESSSDPRLVTVTACFA